MRAIIIGNGTIEDLSIIKKYYTSGDVLISCDGGIRYCFEEGFMPNYVIGDFDSSSEQMIQFFENRGSIIKKFPRKKDNTDMDICVEFSIGLGATDILIFGGIGTRFDHTLTNAHILLKANNSNVIAKLIDSHNVITLIDREVEVIGQAGEIVSLIPFTNRVTGIYTEGLEYELKSGVLEIGNSLGVSNIMTCSSAKIYIQEGLLFVIKSQD